MVKRRGVRGWSIADGREQLEDLGVVDLINSGGVEALGKVPDLSVEDSHRPILWGAGTRCPSIEVGAAAHGSINGGRSLGGAFVSAS